MSHTFPLFEGNLTEHAAINSLGSAYVDNSEPTLLTRTLSLGSIGLRVLLTLALRDLTQNAVAWDSASDLDEATAKESADSLRESLAQT